MQLSAPLPEPVIRVFFVLRGLDIDPALGHLAAPRGGCRRGLLWILDHGLAYTQGISGLIGYKGQGYIG